MSLRWNPVGHLAVGVFAIASAFGQGLHLLPSANHFSAEAHACDQCHHHGTAPSTDPESKLSHDCPICRFLAQAQLPTVLSTELPLVYSCELANDRQPQRLAPRLVALHLARAPPLAG